MALTRLGPNQAVNLSTNTTGTLGVANGGTGLTSGTTNQFLKFTGSTTLASAADNGKIVQTKMEGNFNFSGDQSSNSTTFAAFGNALTITPTSSSNALMFHLSLTDCYAAASEGIEVTIYDETNATYVNGAEGRAPRMHLDNIGGGINMPINFFSILETAGSGARTYKGYFRSAQAGELVYVNNAGSGGCVRFCVMEVVKDD